MDKLIKAIKKLWYTRPMCPVDKKWCAHYDGVYCTMDGSCLMFKVEL